MARTVTSYIAFYLFSAKNCTCILLVASCYRSHFMPCYSWLYDLLSISTSVTNNYFEKRTYGVRITVTAPVFKHLNILGIGGVNPTF